MVGPQLKWFVTDQAWLDPQDLTARGVEVAREPDLGQGRVLARVGATVEDLVLALKLASDEMKEKVFGNVSSRAADQIREELELSPPRKLSEVEAIQDQVVETARRLADEGVIQLESGEGGDVLV